MLCRLGAPHASGRAGRRVPELDRQRDFRAHEYAVMLECHGSFALVSGYDLSNNSRALVYPVQKAG